MTTTTIDGRTLRLELVGGGLPPSEEEAAAALAAIVCALAEEPAAAGAPAAAPGWNASGTLIVQGLTPTRAPAPPRWSTIERIRRAGRGGYGITGL